MDVSIVILNYRTAGLVRQCVKTLRMYPTRCQSEIIVVDNGSGDGVEDMLSWLFPDVKFIQSGANLGFAGGNNLGLAAASGRYVMVMNPDITVTDGSIDALVDFMDRNRDVGIVGPKLLRPDGSVDDSCYRFPKWVTPVYRRTPLGRLSAGRREIDRYMMSDYDRGETSDVDWLLGAVHIVRRTALERVGPMDDRYFMYFEDTDWCRRFRLAGYRCVYFAGTTMIHYHERLSARQPWFVAPLSRATRIHVASAVKYFLKWRGAPAAAERPGLGLNGAAARAESVKEKERVS